MARHVALLRGVNIGRAKRVAMADLRAVVEELGCSNVRTLLNSGNIVFDAPRASNAQLTARLEKALPLRTGVSSRITVITATDLARIVDENDLVRHASNPSRLLVVFVRRAADLKPLNAVAREKWQPEMLSIGPRAAYLWIPEGFLVSKLDQAVNRAMGDRITVRNWATVLKLHALAKAP